MNVHKSEKYITIFKLAVIQTLKNYKAIIGLSIFLVTCLIIFANLWKVAAAKIGAFDLKPDQLLWYIALNEWVLVATPEVASDMESDLRTGRLAYLLPRPLSYLLAIFFQAFGELCVNLITLGFVTFTFTWLMVGSFPFDTFSFIVSLLLGCLAGCVGIIFRMLVGISAFWLQEVEPFDWIWEKLLFALGGLMLPLAVYPEWLQKIAFLTPFPAILGERSALAIQYNFTNVVFVIGSLTLWGAIGIAFLIGLYRRGLRILNIEGG